MASNSDEARPTQQLGPPPPPSRVLLGGKYEPVSPAGEGGVAYAAHIGGFIAGVALIKLFAIGRGR